MDKSTQRFLLLRSNGCSTKAAILYAVLALQFLVLLTYMQSVNYSWTTSTIQTGFNESSRLPTNDSNGAIMSSKTLDELIGEMEQIGKILGGNESDQKHSGVQHSKTRMVSAPGRNRTVKKKAGKPKSSNSTSTSIDDSPSMEADQSESTTTLEPSEPKCGYFVRSPPSGQLGNQMFAYAAFYGVARSMVVDKKVKKKTFIRQWDTSYRLGDVFEGLSVPQLVVNESFFEQRKFQSRSEQYGCCRYDSHLLDELACDGKNVQMDGYRQSYKYFDKYLPDLRKEYTFRAEIRAKGRRLLNSALANSSLTDANCTIVGVHLRRGDFALPHKEDFGHSPARVEYLQKAVRFFEIEIHQNHQYSNEDKSKNLLFLIFGDDFEWNTKAAEKVQLIETNRTHLYLVNSRDSEPTTDMYTIGICDHAILSAGSFGWWSAFFNRGMVTYQKEYSRRGSRHFGEYLTRDYLLPHWIAL